MENIPLNNTNVFNRSFPDDNMTDEINPKIRLPIKGMVCDGCVESVKKALESVEGVESADVNLKKKEALVTYDPVLTTKHKLHKAVQSAGYDIGE